ncbi:MULTISPECIES: MobF family relaxase [unclassified Nocardioides]|uniref:MobF family relaxase n=1 Tax=unclassified Nocardioides TaxID=2615069 RepID=UPI000A26ECEA|nr:MULTISPECIES: MobF family relaxase [unclassified Nocardioides]
MGVHKLTAGDGYTYLTRQVAVHDASDRGHAGLADYYAEKGESPGRWFGTGLAVLDLAAGSQVTETQMRNLFGEGRHPDAERLENAALDAGKSVEQAKKASQLGRVFARYLGNQPEFIRETAKRYIAYNLAHGEHWKTPVPAEVRARVRTELANEHFVREHDRAPIDDRERGSFMAKAIRQQTTAVAGYDLTFTPVKSVSTLWALADREVAKEIEAAHHGAVEATLAWLEKEVLFTRRGRSGIQQVRAKGLIAGIFTHRDARSGDPHLHTHVAVSNKVQDATDRWLAVDGRVLFKANVTLSEMYNTRLEAELITRLGVRFENRHAGVKKGVEKRPVREIVGLDERLATTWSKRDTMIEARRRELAAAFQAEHGRPPTEGEAVTLKEQAWEQTRQAKHEPRAEADQRAGWMTEACAIIGSEQAVREMVTGCLGHLPAAQDVTDKWVAETAQRVVNRVAEDRATWQVWHLRAEAQRQVRADGVRLADHDTAVDRVVATAISKHSIAFGDPDPLTHAATAMTTTAGLTERQDGPVVRIPARLQRTEHGPQGEMVVSVYSLAGARQYTSQAVIDAERRIVASARRTGGRTISEVRVGIAIAEAAANSATTGLQLNAAQQSLVREMATSGRAVQLALAPAGTGKTTAMQVLTRAWQDSGGTVIGLAPSAVAAQELGASINLETPDSTRANAAANVRGPLNRPWRPGRKKVRADTLAKLVFHAKYVGPTEWMKKIDHKTLVLIDEAGMAATTDLAVAIDYITARGGQVRLVGDDRQLASVAAGGVLRDIAHQIGAVTLSEVHRFRNPDGSLNHAEAAATLALREGDPSAVAFYADRGRIHIGDLGTCADQAYAAWAADHAAGIDSILIAPTRDLVAELNNRARNDRLDALHANGGEEQIGRVLTLADRTQVSAGDRIITRQNERRLPITHTDWVKNGDRWHVAKVNTDGSLKVRHDKLGKTITLPADYVSKTVQLGYATTVHGAQGITTGTSHVVLTGGEDRNLLYVALSRGKFANHLYLNVASDGDPHNLIRPEALIPPTALDRIVEMLRRDGSPVSATTTMRELGDPHQRLGDMAARYHDAVTAGAEHLIGPVGMNKIDTHAEALFTGLTEAHAWPTLRSHLALLALNDHSPLKLLSAAVSIGSLADTRDPAAVLDTRIDDLLATGFTTGVTGLTPAILYDTSTPPATSPTAAEGPLPWLPGIPARLAQAHDWGPFAAAYHRLVREHIDAVRHEARGWTGATAPAWAQPLLEEEDTELRADIAVWRAVAKTDVNDLRPTGERAIGAPGLHQRKLNRAVRTARPSYPFARRTWYQVLPETVRTDSWITPLCQRLARLERAGLPVADYIQQALATDPSLPSSLPGGQTSPETNTDTAAAARPLTARPLPDEQQAAALWWRLVPHLGPAALAADERSADLLQPAWRTALTELVGATRADYLHRAPAWPALVAAVDEACEHHGCSPTQILASALDGIPKDGSLSGIEVADALVLRIAMLTDQPSEASLHSDEEPPLYDDPDLLPPEDAAEFMAELYRDQLDTGSDIGYDPAEEPPGWDPPFTGPGDAAYEHPATSYVDPYTPLPPWEQPDDACVEHAFPEPNEVPAARIRELNRLALTFFESCYPRSWAPAYLRERLGTDLADQPNYTVGYAPGSGSSLMRHLTEQGAALDEVEQAGLVSLRERDNGTTYYRDFFRDRLIMPIRDPHDPTGEAILGFIGRRNPTKTDDDQERNWAGPKYLNTRTTPVFSKGEALFGYAEAHELLTRGALPVIVEGPMDALAITLGSNGAAAGIAPMGTALTVDQIKLLRAHISLVSGRDRIAVATDSDPAGWKSAQKAFWHLTAADLDPTYLDLPDGLDPANLFETGGSTAIAAAIEHRSPLGDAMIDNLLRTAGHWTDTDVRQKLINQTAQLLAVRGSEHWLPGCERLRAKLHLAPGILEHQTVTESMDRERNRLAYAQTRIDEINDDARKQAARTASQSRPREAEQRLAAGTATTRPDHPAPPAGPEPASPSR